MKYITNIKILIRLINKDYRYLIFLTECFKKIFKINLVYIKYIRIIRNKVSKINMILLFINIVITWMG